MDIKFPTKFHEEVFNKSVEFLKKEDEILALVLLGSLARGDSSFDSDIDIFAFIKHPEKSKEITQRFNEFSKTIHDPGNVGNFFHIDFIIVDYEITPKPRGWTDGPDEFELEIGNLFVYSKLVFEKDEYFTKLKSEFLPYYGENLQKERLKDVLKYCTNNIGHVEPYVRRGLYFQAFKRHIDATREFLQALFISKKIYPISYDKWIKKQLVEILGMPELYRDFVSLYEIQHLESEELIEKANKLSALVEKYIGPIA